MCAIGRALMANPKMVLLDEPSMGLAPQIVEEVFEIVKDLNTKERVTFLLAEQNTNMALRYADYGYILENGRIVMDGEAKALRENEDVKEFYLGMGGGDRKSFRDVKSTSGASAGCPDHPMADGQRLRIRAGKAPAFDAANALVQVRRSLRDLRLAERGNSFELKGRAVVQLAVEDGVAIAARLARRLSMTPEWDRHDRQERRRPAQAGRRGEAPARTLATTRIEGSARHDRRTTTTRSRPATRQPAKPR
jgi:ABC-type sulfate/molybdate transport systems ATPase subunit